MAGSKGTDGIGVRVFIGWIAHCSPRSACGLCRRGTIIDGPFAPGEVCTTGVRKPTNKTAWAVDVDELSCELGPAYAAESILLPIDDDPEISETERAREVTA